MFVFLLLMMCTVVISIAIMYFHMQVVLFVCWVCFYYVLFYLSVHVPPGVSSYVPYQYDSFNVFCVCFSLLLVLWCIVVLCLLVLCCFLLCFFSVVVLLCCLLVVSLLLLVWLLMCCMFININMSVRLFVFVMFRICIIMSCVRLIHVVGVLHRCPMFLLTCLRFLHRMCVCPSSSHCVVVSCFSCVCCLIFPSVFLSITVVIRVCCVCVFVFHVSYFHLCYQYHAVHSTLLVFVFVFVFVLYVVFPLLLLLFLCVLVVMLLLYYVVLFDSCVACL